jgi:bisphosphoglycerate-dependent phosphoglycerate mutase
MNRLILIRHGGSTGNEDPSFYDYSDSALCLTTNGIR